MSAYDQSDNAFRSALNDYTSSYGSIAQSRLGTDIGLESSKESLYSAGAQIKDSAGLEKISNKILSQGNEYLNEMGVDMSASGVLTGAGYVLKGVGNTMRFFSAKSGLGLDNSNAASFSRGARNAPGRYKALNVDREEPFRAPLRERMTSAQDISDARQQTSSEGRQAPLQEDQRPTPLGDTDAPDLPSYRSAPSFTEDAPDLPSYRSAPSFTEDAPEVPSYRSAPKYVEDAPEAPTAPEPSYRSAPSYVEDAPEPPTAPEPSYRSAPSYVEDAPEPPTAPELPSYRSAPGYADEPIDEFSGSSFIARPPKSLAADAGIDADATNAFSDASPRALTLDDLRLPDRPTGVTAGESTLRTTRAMDTQVDSTGGDFMRLKSTTVGRPAPQVPRSVERMQQGDDTAPTSAEQLDDPGLQPIRTAPPPQAAADTAPTSISRNPAPPPQAAADADTAPTSISRNPDTPPRAAADAGLDADSGVDPARLGGQSAEDYTRSLYEPGDPDAMLPAAPRGAPGGAPGGAGGGAGGGGAGGDASAAETQLTNEARTVATQGQADVSSAESNLTSEIGQETSAAERTAATVTEDVAPEISAATETMAASGWATAGSMALTGGSALLRLAGIAALPLAGFGLYESIKGIEDNLNDENVDPYAKIRTQVAAANTHLNAMSQTISADQFASTVAGAAPKFGSLAAPTFNTAAMTTGGMTGHF